jgi:hypothetical protein
MSPDLTPPIHLVLGKFDPELPDQWTTPFDCFELDSGLWFGLSAAKRARFKRRLLDRGMKVLVRTVLRPIREPEILAERLRLLEEELAGVVRLQVLSAGRRVFDLEPACAWVPSIREALATSRVPLVLEWGEGDTGAGFRRWMRDFPDAGWMIDPDHHTIRKGPTPTTLHCKLHGWDPARWVRRYGETRAREIVGKIMRTPLLKSDSTDGIFLVLSHSGRREEFEIFSGAIASREE